MTALEILWIVPVIVAVIFILLWISGKEKIKEQKETIDRLNQQLVNAMSEISKLQSAISAYNKNRKEADEKIDALHDGDAVDNAINVLRGDKVR